MFITDLVANIFAQYTLHCGFQFLLYRKYSCLLFLFLIILFTILGQHGSLTQIYREGDDYVNSMSEYAKPVLEKNKSSKTDNSVAAKQPEEEKPAHVSARNSPSDRVKARDPNRLSPTAKSFVSRRSPTIPVHVPYTQTAVTTGYPPKPIANVDYTRKAYWQPTPVYAPVARMQAHNYMIAQEIARFEAHLKAQRIALHAQYYQTPFQYMKHLPGYYPLSQAKAPTQSNSSLRVQVVA